MNSRNSPKGTIPGDTNRDSNPVVDLQDNLGNDVTQKSYLKAILQRSLIAIPIFVLLGLATFLLITQPNQFDEGSLPEHNVDLAHGELMFWTGGCSSCHAKADAKGSDKLILGGGLALETPFGRFNVPNISPDVNTGIGSWRTIDFVNAMVNGVSPKGDHYYPAFPYTNYQRMPIEDLIDLKAFLDLLPKSTTVNIDHELNFPFNIRRGLGLWKTLYLDGQSFAYNQSRTGTELRGKYLVEGPGHCAACHSPRNLLGGKISTENLSGTAAIENSPGKKAGVIPNITPHKDGIAGWSESDIAYALETGFKPDFDSFGSTMVSVQNNLANLSPEDRLAIAAYLKSLPTIASKKTSD